ncbi:MAG: diphthine synthase [Nanoarchaeota archaeon]
MTLYMIGIGLHDYKDITLKGLEIVQQADHVYIDSYTSILHTPLEQLETFYKRPIKCATRETIEIQGDIIINLAKEKKIAFLIIGDVFGATTHTDLYLRAIKSGVNVEYIPNASILTAVGITGLSLYKFGKVASIPFNATQHNIDTPYHALAQNQKHQLHTLFLLDLDPYTEHFMTIQEALEELRHMETRNNQNIFSDNTTCIVCARIGGPDMFIKVGLAKEITHIDFGKPPYCIIIPATLHFMEQELLNYYRI